jgi:membrane-bound lytic murein transglycosylase B
MERGAAALAAALLVVGAVAAQAASGPPCSRLATGDARTWAYVIDKLADDGLDCQRVLRVFSDPRFPPFDGLSFSLVPGESRAPYRKLLSASSVASARRCYYENHRALRAAERRHGVPAGVVAAIVHVESACGRNTGSSRILPRLARLAMANDPANLHSNVRRHTAGRHGAAREDVERRTRARAVVLEEMFYPEVRATFVIADKGRFDPLEMRGSYAGAFGIPQFLPTSYLLHGEDGNGDGYVSLYDHDDAIASCAKYLAAHGWKPGMSSAEKRKVVWEYNHSDAYIDTVLALSERLP